MFLLKFCFERRMEEGMAGRMKGEIKRKQKERRERERRGKKS